MQRVTIVYWQEDDGKWAWVLEEVPGLHDAR